ncbi:MAG: ATP-dependent DNA helicase [Clostridia bacterium]|nr:ATP-dependent DNA helicase [Clostridia bacterium]
MNKSIIISTSTIALQEQLQKDIATLNSILSWDVPSIIAKGRTHYICKKKVTDSNLLHELEENPTKIDRVDYDKYNEYEWNKINIDKCEYRECEYYNSCYFVELRNKIRNFQGIIICNHDLLLENQKRKTYERRLLLPNVKYIVLDEAHNLEEKGRNSFKEDITLQECREILNRTQSILSRFNYFNIENIELAQDSISKIFEILNKQIEQQVQEAIQNNRIIAENDLEICKVFGTPELIKNSSTFYSAIQNIDIYIQTLNYGDSEDIDNLLTDLEKLEDIFKNLKEIESDNIFWIENKRKIVLNTCSKYVNKQIRNVLFDDKSSIKILTSATLNTSNKGEVLYEYFTKNVGLEIDEELFLSEPKMSPFDYENNMICYCCKDITAPNGNHDDYIRDITRKILELLNITNGKTLILFTSKADMKLVYENLKVENLPFEILIQKDGSSQNATKEEFKNNINSVLLSTGSFWEGIDIKGKSLSNVIIVRLPFPIPDPIIEYKCSIVDDNEKVLVPEMKIKLKQGIGRLIRGKDDTGIISILDSRIERHLNKVLECIPTSNITYNIDDVKKFVIKNKIIE